MGDNVLHVNISPPSWNGLKLLIFLSFRAVRRVDAVWGCRGLG